MQVLRRLLFLLALFRGVFLLLLLLVVMSLCLRLSVSAPHSLTPYRRVSWLASGLPGSSLLPPRLPPCSVRRSYSWVLRLRLLLLAGSFGVRFPGLGFCQWSGRPCAFCPGTLRAVHGFCLVACSLSAGFCLPLQIYSPSFHSPQPRSLSLSALLAPASRPWSYSWLAPVSVLATFVARVVPRHLLVVYLLVSLRFCTVIFRSLFPTFLVGSSSSAFPWRPSGLSGALVGLPGSLLCLPPGYRSSSSQFPVVWLVLLLPSLRPYTRPLFGLLAVPPFLLSVLIAVCFP